jgi:hypothetical protein
MAVCQLAELAEELAAEVVVATLALDGLDDEAGDVIGVPGDGGLDGGDGLGFGRLGQGDVGRVLGERDLRIGDPGPVELGEVLVLPGIGRVGEAQRVAAAAVEGLAEMEDLGALLALSSRQVLADLPVEGGLEGVLHRQGASVDPEEVGQVVRCGRGTKGLHPLREGLGVDVRVRRFVDGDGSQTGLEGRIDQAGVVVA